MAHWYVVGVLVLGAASGLAYYVWDLTRSYLDLQDKCFSQGREITRLCGERFDLQGKLMQAEQANADAFNQAETWRHQETDLRGQLARLRDEAHKYKTDFIRASNEWDSQKSDMLAKFDMLLAEKLKDIQSQYADHYSTIRRRIAQLYLEVGGNLELYKLMEQAEDNKT